MGVKNPAAGSNRRQGGIGHPSTESR